MLSKAPADWNSNLTDAFVFDIECNGKLYDATDIHCIVMKHVTTGEVLSFFELSKLTFVKPGLCWCGDIKRGLMYLLTSAKAGTYLIGHNITGFDYPVVNKLYGSYAPLDPWHIKTIDTMIVSQLLSPETEHSLEYWGQQLLGQSKVVIEDWSTLTEDMIERCIKDVEINVALFKFQQHFLYEVNEHGESVWYDALQREQKVNFIHSLQTQKGVLFDMVAAMELYNTLSDEFARIEKLVQDEMPWISESIKTKKLIDKPFTDKGTLCERAKAWLGEVVDGSKVGPFSKVAFRKVNVKSPDELKGVLLQLGWKPTQWNVNKKTGKATSPKITEDSFDSLPTGLGENIGKLLILKHRLSFLLNDGDLSKGAIPEVREDSRHPADGITCGTPTARYRHIGKVVNLPRPSSPYGMELRSLFIVPEGFSMLGSDLKGIEARLMGHFAALFDEGELISVLLKEDIHSYNARTLGITRSQAKVFLYSLSYGAGSKKLARLLGISEQRAAALVKNYWLINWGLDKLRKNLKNAYQANRGFIYGLDGRKVFIRSEHKLLNSLIQSSASIIFKEWMIRCHEEIRRVGLSSEQIIAYHDELEFEVPNKRFGQILYEIDFMIPTIEDSAKKAGDAFGIKIPIECDCKVGKNYAEVH